MIKKLYKSNTDRVIAGIFGGIGQYFDIDSVILRLAYLVVCVLTGLFPFIIVYIIACFIVPSQPHLHHTHHI